jgi:hypothetical protein
MSVHLSEDTVCLTSGPQGTGVCPRDSVESYSPPLSLLLDSEAFGSACEGLAALPSLQWLAGLWDRDPREPALRLHPHDRGLAHPSKFPFAHASVVLPLSRTRRKRRSPGLQSASIAQTSPGLTVLRCALSRVCYIIFSDASATLPGAGVVSCSRNLGCLPPNARGQTKPYGPRMEERRYQ